MSDASESQGPVLIAYDGSDCARAAIEEAARLTPGRSAIVLTVWAPLDSIPFLGAGGAPIDQVAVETLLNESEHGAGRVAAEGAELARASGLDATELVESGDPIWRRIVEVAEQRRASIVVIGSRGRSGLGYALLGSVASAVARHLSCPVLIVHSRT